MLASCSVMVAVAPLGAATVDAKRSFDLPRGDAATTLRQFAAAAGRSLVFVTDKVRGETTNAVRGDFTPREALDRMLAGSALEAAQDAATGALVVSRRRTAEVAPRTDDVGPVSDPQPKANHIVNSSKSHTLFAALASWLALGSAADGQTAARPSGDDTIVLSPFEVRTAQDEGYRSANSASGSKTGTAVRETPQSIQIVNASFMDDIQARSIADALVYTSGITEGQNSRGDRFEIRGFTTGIPFKNGFRDTGRAPRDTANFDRIEVAKGPASVIFSRTSAGGAVNILTKLPQPRRTTEVSAIWGGNDYFRGTLDFTGPLSGDKLLYRLNIAWQDSGSYRDSVFAHRLYFSPVVSYTFGPRTRLNVEFEYLRDRRVNDSGIVALGDRVLKVPARTFYGDADDVNSTEQLIARYELLHTFASGIALRHALRVNQTNERGFDTQFNSVNATTLLLNRTRRYLAAEGVDNFYAQTEATYEVRATGGRHRLIGGFEVGYNFDGGITHNAPLTATSILNPGRGVTGAFANNRWVDSTIWYDEYFVQDQFYTFGDKLALLAGARLAHFESFTTNKRTGVKTNTSGRSPNPRFGIVWLPNDRLSFFLNHSDLVTPSTATNPDGSSFEPVKSVLTEAGVRLDVFQRRLTITGALFELTNTNTLNPDPARPGYQIPTGEQRTRGLELDLTGSPLPGWQLIGSTNYTKAVVTRDLVNPAGSRLANTPFRTYSLWNRYGFRNGTLNGLGVGLGVVAVGGRYGDVANTFYIPAYLRLDAALSYRTKKWDISLNVQNLADEDYIRASSGRLSIRPGSPRDFSLRFRQRL